ncbi:MAG: hypothetical protein Q4D73_03825 [Actinomycetaceae bacterium]|nr:hypothetical protein [Actinomycetaceae bacterium]
MLFSDALPIRYGTVKLHPQQAVQLATEHLLANGFKPTNYNLDAALHAQGFSPAGWTGQIVTKGSGFRGFLVDAVPVATLATLLPGTKNLHATVMVSVLARVTDQGETELYYSYLEQDISDNSMQTRKNIIKIFEAFPQALAERGIALTSWQSLRARDLPLEHPLNLNTWGKLFKAARRAK